MRTIVHVFFFAALIQVIALSGCGPVSSSDEAIAPASFAPPPTKKRRKAQPASKKALHMGRIETATQVACLGQQHSQLNSIN